MSDLRLESSFVSCEVKARGGQSARWAPLSEQGDGTTSPLEQWVQCSLGYRWVCGGLGRADVSRALAYPLNSLHHVFHPVLRCLGIPTRVVTNYNSAHDQNSNLLIEYFRNEYGEIQSDKSEMIW